jgi:hypothetical protein
MLPLNTRFGAVFPVYLPIAPLLVGHLWKYLEPAQLTHDYPVLRAVHVEGR